MLNDSLSAKDNIRSVKHGLTCFYQAFLSSPESKKTSFSANIVITIIREKKLEVHDKLAKIHSESENWSVDVFFTVLNGVSTKKRFFDFSRKLRKFSICSQKFDKFLQKSKIDQYFLKNRRNFFPSNIIYNIEKHIH